MKLVLPEVDRSERSSGVTVSVTFFEPHGRRVQSPSDGQKESRRSQIVFRFRQRNDQPIFQTENLEDCGGFVNSEVGPESVVASLRHHLVASVPPVVSDHSGRGRHHG